jgi:hypothetical protein
LEKVSRELTTTVIQGNAGLPVISHSGRLFMPGSAPRLEFPNEPFRQSIQDTIGESTSAFLQSADDFRGK